MPAEPSHPTNGAAAPDHKSRIGLDAPRNMWDEALLARMKRVVGGTTRRTIAERTGVHPETVRRYLNDGRPSAFFIAALCRAYDMAPGWLLLGEPPTSGHEGAETHRTARSPDR